MDRRLLLWWLLRGMSEGSAMFWTAVLISWMVFDISHLDLPDCNCVSACSTWPILVISCSRTAEFCSIWPEIFLRLFSTLLNPTVSGVVRSDMLCLLNSGVSVCSLA